MGNLIANRSFVYSGPADAIKQWLHDHGYTTEDVFGDQNQAMVFKIRGTGIKIGYHRPINENDTGRPKIHLLNGPHLVETDPLAAQRGLDLYPKLYNRFRERKPKA